MMRRLKMINKLSINDQLHTNKQYTFKLQRKIASHIFFLVKTSYKNNFS